jgi:carbamoyl-phosphate synthase/aspartate carbamoyltransferase/dihydroorotase
MYLNETFNSLKMDKLEYVRKHFETWPKNKPICCHAEEHTLAAVLFFAELYDRHVHICHVSTKDDIHLIRAAKERGLRVTCEVAPHHLFFSNKDMSQFAPEMKEVRPRLKTEEDRQALWKCFNWIDCIASDHAPHTLEEKQQQQQSVPPGFPGLETTLPLLITAYKQGKISLNQIIEKCYTNPKRIFNLPDQPDTYIEVDLDTEWQLPDAMPMSKCKWTPFAGMRVFGMVSRVILRGEVVYVDGQVLAKPGYGQNVFTISSSSTPMTMSKSAIGPILSDRQSLLVPPLVSNNKLFHHHEIISSSSTSNSKQNSPIKRNVNVAGNAGGLLSLASATITTDPNVVAGANGNELKQQHHHQHQQQQQQQRRMRQISSTYMNGRTF